MKKIRPKKIVPEAVNESGLKRQEQAVMNKLMECFGLFLDLECEHAYVLHSVRPAR